MRHINQSEVMRIQVILKHIAHNHRIENYAVSLIL